jgi:16S rRNA processing protein RimM
MSFVLIGKVHSPQGIRGELYISVFAEEAAWVEKWDTLYVSSVDENQPSQDYKIVSARPHQKQNRWGFVIRLQDMNDRNQAEAMKGLNVYIPESFLVSAEGEEIYLREVLGFRVIDQTRGEVGEVIGFSGNAMQDLLVIKGQKGKFEVPFVEPIHQSTDKDNKTLHMDIPQGLVAGEEL